MKLHTNRLHRADFLSALRRQKALGNIAEDVLFDTLDEHRSKTHQRRFDIKLEAVTKVAGDGRYQRNSGRHGPEYDAYSATYDEWGYLLGDLFRQDPDMVTEHYAGRTMFLVKTGYSYDDEALLFVLANQGQDPFPWLVGRTSGRTGRTGAGRSAGHEIPEAVKAGIRGTGPMIHGHDVFWRPRSLVSVATRVEAIRNQIAQAA